MKHRQVIYLLFAASSLDYRQSQSGVTIVGLGWFSPTDRKTFAVYRVFDTEGATFPRFSQRIRG